MQFQRITTQKRFIPQIDGLRFVAIASVVFFHIHYALVRDAHVVSGLAAPAQALNNDLAKRGVELFFGISGFILGVPFASRYLLNAPQVRLRQYFLRRLTRLEPPYFLSLGVWAAVQILFAHRLLVEIAPHLLASSFYVHNLIFGGFPGAVNMVAWSLEVEVQFYMLVPLLSLLFSIANAGLRRALILLIMSVAGIASNALYPSLHFHYSIAYYLAFFLAGFLVCDLYLSYPGSRQSFRWDVAAFCLWPLVWYLGRNSGHIAVPFLIVVLYVAAFRGPICSKILSNRVITDIGGMCYSIYLFHPLVIAAVERLTKSWHIGTRFWVYLVFQSCMIVPAVLVVCGSFFLLVERPCMDRDWPGKLWSRWQRLTSRVSQPSVTSIPIPDGLIESESDRSHLPAHSDDPAARPSRSGV